MRWIFLISILFSFNLVWAQNDCICTRDNSLEEISNRNKAFRYGELIDSFAYRFRFFSSQSYVVFAEIDLPSFELKLVQSNENECYFDFFAKKIPEFIAREAFRDKHQNLPYSKLIIPIVVNSWGIPTKHEIGLEKEDLVFCEEWKNKYETVDNYFVYRPLCFSYIVSHSTKGCVGQKE